MWTKTADEILESAKQELERFALPVRALSPLQRHHSVSDVHGDSASARLWVPRQRDLDQGGESPVDDNLSSGFGRPQFWAPHQGREQLHSRRDAELRGGDDKVIALLDDQIELQVARVRPRPAAAKFRPARASARASPGRRSPDRTRR